MGKKELSFDQMSELAGDAYGKVDFEAAMQLYEKYLDSPLRMDAVLGYGFSAIQLKKYDEAIAVLKVAGDEGRYQFCRYVALLLGCIYSATGREEEAVAAYDTCLHLIVEGGDENGDETDFTEDDVVDFDPLEDLDASDEDDDDDEYGYELEDKESKPLRYRDYMRYYSMEIAACPGIVESLADYLDNNEKWLSPDLTNKWRIGNELEYFAEIVKIRIADSKENEKAADEENKKIANRLKDLAVQYHPRLSASVMYEKAQEARRANNADGINKLRELILVHPEHTNSLRDLSMAAFREEDFDQAATLMARCAGVYEKNGWDKAGSQADVEKKVFLAAGFHYAEAGDHAAAATLLTKFLALSRPEVFQYITRPDHHPEDVWVAMAEGYMQKAFPRLEPEEVRRRSLLLADIALAVGNPVRAHVVKVAVHLESGQYDAAQASLDAGYAADPDHANIVYNHACLLSLTGAPVVEVIPVLKKALMLEPSLTYSARWDNDFTRLRSEVAFQELFN